MKSKKEESELGFGSKTSVQRSRLINHDGSFNIERIEKDGVASISIYHSLVTMSWLKFNLFVVIYFITINLLFTCLCYFTGVEGLRGVEGTSELDKFAPLELELKKIVFFPMTWTINHLIDENSPLWGMSAQDPIDSDAEFMILLNGFDDTFYQTVNTRFSYTHEEVIYGAKLISVFGQSKEGRVLQDLNKLNDIEMIPFS